MAAASPPASAPASAPSPVEKRVAQLLELWLRHTEDPRVRLLVWRIPDNADRMLLAFFEAQRRGGNGTAPDLFIRFDTAFETSFGYSRALSEGLVAGYLDSAESLQRDGLAMDWPHASQPAPDSAAGCMARLGSFAQHHQASLRLLAAVLMPARVSSGEALAAWLEAALHAPVPPGVRLCVVDTHSTPQWQPLAKRYPALVRVIQAPIDSFDLLRETAAQAGGAGPAVAYRQLLADVLLLVEKGTAAQAAARAERALKIATEQHWWDQQVVLHMAVAGAHLKEQAHGPAIARYQQARGCAEQAVASGSPVGGNLVMQTCFGEAGAWLAAQRPERAAAAYRAGAEQAQRLPHAMFAIEGFRMAAYTLAQAQQREAARDAGLLAIVEGKAVAADERATTTLPLALQDLLRLQDAGRADKLEKTAAQYQAAVAEAHVQAERQAARLGAAPAAPDIGRVETELHHRLELAFQRLREQRDSLIAGGDVFFRKVVAVGRELLHPQWNGLPEVRHPLDNEVAEWRTPPASLVLPDAADLLAGGVAATAPPADGQTAAVCS